MQGVKIFAIYAFFSIYYRFIVGASKNKNKCRTFSCVVFGVATGPSLSNPVIEENFVFLFDSLYNRERRV